ncbi:unnamed protein product [Protopolystoma xenopodis]|uniref:Uncharacterized protein n=1 Tax=Protopolystoma xenopodis TaxID=117903 RepID=A0A3S4ZZB6_9PLAT|nr:unnamed protein product [Protopolystoma xenopodis]
MLANRNSNSPFLALAGNLCIQADSHLVCFQQPCSDSPNTDIWNYCSEGPNSGLIDLNTSDLHKTDYFSDIQHPGYWTQAISMENTERRVRTFCFSLKLQIDKCLLLEFK